MYTMVRTKCTLFTLAHLSLLAVGLFSRSRLRGTQRGRVYSRGTFRPRPWPVARALRVQSRSSWQANAGFCISSRRASQDNGTPPKIRFLLCCCCIMSVSHRAPSSQALYLVAATVQQQSHIKPASFYDDRGRCISVCMFVPCFLST